MGHGEYNCIKETTLDIPKVVFYVKSALKNTWKHLIKSKIASSKIIQLKNH